MALLINCSVGNVNLFPEVTIIQAKRIQLTKYSTSFKHVKRVLHTRGYGFPQSSLQFSQIYRISFYHRYGSGSQTIAAVGTDVAVEDPDPTVSGEVSDEAEGTSISSVEISETAATTPVTTSTVRSKRPKPVRKSEMLLVKDEELIPGASFVGKVRSTQPFGAFVDFGAFTDGLVHVSRISDAYVKDVAAAISIGQEVKVKIVEVNKETGRISLTMRDSDDASKTQQRKEPPASGSSDKPRSAMKNSARSNQKRDEGQKSTKLVKGQVLDGTVKNLARSGAFVSLPDGEEGFLPVSEESEGFGNILGNSSLHSGKQVKVRVLRITRGQVTLTMKKEEDVEAINRQLNRGVVHVATNPFELAFRQNKDIAAFLNERETMQKKALLVDEEKVKELSIVSDEATISTPSSSGLGLEDKKTTSEVLLEEYSSLESITDDQVSSYVEPISYSSQDAISILDTSIKENNSTSPTDSYSIVSDEVSESVSESDSEKRSTSDEVKGNEIPDLTVSQDVESSKALTIEENVSSITNDISAALKESDVPDITVSEDGENSINSSANENVLEPDITEAEFSEKANGEVLATEVAYEEAASSLSNGVIINGAMEDKAPPIIEKEAASSNSTNTEAPETSIGQSGNHDQGNTVKATISPILVKQLREESGAGMMDCKKALTETDGDIVKAQEFLRKKGLASADKKASRATAEGRIGSYIHDSRIGVLIEVNCETDFVSRGEIFLQLVDDLAMQVAACPQVSYLVMEDVPEEIVNKERKIESQKEDLLTKPEQIRAKIVDGRINKRLAEFALLEQPYIKNDKMTVKDWVKQRIATVGENIQVKRFIRYNLGEGLEKKSQDFAAEVAAQTTANPPSAQKDQPAETKEAVDKPATSAISAALVKQLREETGAGMMDCKKALTETGGNLEKARDSLRKKGLSSAEKKSSRLAAEGRISSYIHDSRIGCLIEVNSETDFVARNEKFIELVDDLAMQVVACPQVQFVSVEDIPESIVNKEKEFEMQREDLQSKPEQIRERIVEGRISKRLGELALLEQPFIKDDSVLVKDLVKQNVAALGENIKVRRFVRYSLGEAQD